MLRVLLVRVELVYLQVGAALIAVLVLLDVKHGGAQVFEVGCGLGHLKVLLDLHNFIELGEEACRESVVFG